MTIIEAPHEVRAVFAGRTRTVAALALVIGPLVMLLAFLAGTWAERSAPGKDDVAVAIAAPTASAIATLLDILSVPCMIAFCIVLFLATRAWSPRAAWIGTSAMILQLTGLAGVAGGELFSAAIGQSGVDPAVINSASDRLSSNPAGVFLFILFMPMEIVGLIALGIALWRTRWVPRVVAILTWAFPVIDIGLPDHPKILHVVAFALFLAAFVLLAGRLTRTGGDLPPDVRQTG